MSLRLNPGPCDVCSEPTEYNVGRWLCERCGASHEIICGVCKQLPCPACKGQLQPIKEIFPNSLFAAIREGNLSRLKELLRKHRPDLDTLLEEGRTPLQVACSTSARKDKAAAVAIYEELIAQGASPCARGAYGRTALMVAARGALSKSLISLLQVSINDQDDQGRTALTFAVGGNSGFGSQKGNATVVKELLAAGADPTIKTKSERTALSFANELNKTGQNEVIVELLKKAIVDYTAHRWFQKEFRHDFDKYGNLVFKKR